MRDWMTIFDRVPLEPESPLEPNAEYYVRVRLYMHARGATCRSVGLAFGRRRRPGRADFTFIR